MRTTASCSRNFKVQTKIVLELNVFDIPWRDAWQLPPMHEILGPWSEKEDASDPQDKAPSK
jgi:hypothetical protein